VVGIGVLVGTNPYFQTAGANADGYWHPEDEALLPWFARQAPNTTSEKLQHARPGVTPSSVTSTHTRGFSSQRPVAEDSP
jgi:hypothetical protein